MALGNVSKQGLFGSDWLFLKIGKSVSYTESQSSTVICVLGGKKSLVSSRGFAADRLTQGCILRFIFKSHMVGCKNITCDKTFRQKHKEPTRGCVNSTRNNTAVMPLFQKLYQILFFFFFPYVWVFKISFDVLNFLIHLFHLFR